MTFRYDLQSVKVNQHVKKYTGQSHYFSLLYLNKTTVVIDKNVRTFENLTTLQTCVFLYKIMERCAISTGQLRFLLLLTLISLVLIRWHTN